MLIKRNRFKGLSRIFKGLNKRDRLECLLFCLALALAFFVRTYRIHELLGFYYDQGRDALIIWDFIHNGKFFLIGPTTGIAGIFRGPWYYWLITPLYFIGKGNPAYPSVFLSATTVLAVYILFKLAKKIVNSWAAWIALFIGGFSFPIVNSSRWLSNPTPMFLISVLFVLSLFLIVDGRKKAFLVSGIVTGLAMQFGSATEIFYVPVVLLITFLYRRHELNIKNASIFILAYITVFTPQVIFDFRHGFILTKAIREFLFQEGSFRLGFWETVKARVPFYYEVFVTKLGHRTDTLLVFLLVIVALVFILNVGRFFKNKYFVVVFILFATPLVGMLFFQGNEGYVFEYYFTGYYFVFILLFSSVLGSLSKSWLGKLTIFLFVTYFLFNNLSYIKGYIYSGIDGPIVVALGNQKQALDWIYQDANSRAFNVDEYVPAVIPYAYEYLFKWYGSFKYGLVPEENRVNLLYTLSEVDSPHPERLEAWLKRQDTIGKIVDKVQFGGIMVEKRERIKYE